MHKSNAVLESTVYVLCVGCIHSIRYFTVVQEEGEACRVLRLSRQSIHRRHVARGSSFASSAREAYFRPKSPFGNHRGLYGSVLSVVSIAEVALHVLLET